MFVLSLSRVPWYLAGPQGSFTVPGREFAAPLTDAWSASIQLALRVLVFFFFFQKGDPGVRDFMNLEESAYFENLFRVDFCLKRTFQKSNDKQPLPLPHLVPYRPRRVIL